MDGDSNSILSAIILIVLLFLAAYFAVCETAFASVSRIRLKTAADRGDRRARKAIYVTEHFDKAISTLLIGTNIVHLAAAAYITVLVTRRWGLSAVTLSTIITTVVIFFAGEMLPKSIAKKYSERFSLGTAGSLCFFMRIFTPLSAVLTAIGNFAARLTKGDSEVTVTEDELYDIIETMTDEGGLDEERGELVHSALEFADVTVERVFTPRVDVAALDVTAAHEDILALIREEHYSRLPVYEGNIDNIIGVLQTRKYIRSFLREGKAPELRPLLDEVCFVHLSAPADELLSELNRRKLSLAVVTDNYGGTMGIVSVEDILEELVGEIWDEDDVAREEIRALPDGSFEFSAETDMERVFEALVYDDPEDTDWDRKPLGEWVYEQFDMIPDAGESFTWHRLRVEVAAVEHRRILTLRVSLLPGEGGERE